MLKILSGICPAIALLILSFAADSAAEKMSPSNGIDYPAGWQNWATIAVSHRTDNNTLRVILGNEAAIEAARSGNTNPWPDGAILGKVVWKDSKLENWPAATEPGEFVHAEFMFRDSARYADTHGWGWARWLGKEQTAFDKGPESCIACHQPVQDRDWVFTEPAPLPLLSVPSSHLLDH